MELNPTRQEQQALGSFRAAGVTRLSVGVQALNDGQLAALGRRHSAREALGVVDSALAVFEGRVSVDLYEEATVPPVSLSPCCPSYGSLPAHLPTSLPHYLTTSLPHCLPATLPLFLAASLPRCLLAFFASMQFVSVCNLH